MSSVTEFICILPVRTSLFSIASNRTVGMLINCVAFEKKKILRDACLFSTLSGMIYVAVFQNAISTLIPDCLIAV